MNLKLCSTRDSALDYFRHGQQAFGQLQCQVELEFKHENFCIEREFEKDVVPETLQADISATK